MYEVVGGVYAGLPVTLSHSGLYPFLVSFLLGFLVQVGTCKNIQWQSIFNWRVGA